MNDIDPKPKPAEATPDVQEEYAALKRQVSNLLLALVVLSCTFTLFLIWQARQIKRQYELVKQQATAAMQQKAGVDTLLARLSEYGRTHPDFVPILNKYQIPIAPAPGSTSAPPARTKPAPVPATKKK